MLCWENCYILRRTWLISWIDSLSQISVPRSYLLFRIYLHITNFTFPEVRPVLTVEKRLRKYFRCGCFAFSVRRSLRETKILSSKLFISDDLTIHLVSITFATLYCKREWNYIIALYLLIGKWYTLLWIII